MPQEDGFLTLFSLQKGWKDRYKQLKWLWIAVASAAGLIFGLLTWLYNPELVIPACMIGTLFGAFIFFVFLKCIAANQQKKF